MPSLAELQANVAHATGGGGGSGVSDHGALTGLADDDHPQYLKQSTVVAAIDTELGSTAWQGGGSAEVVFRDVNDTKDRVTASMTGSERSSVDVDKT